MPKVKKDRSSKLIHPNSRKAMQLARATSKGGKRLDKVKDKASKLDIMVQKLLWFHSNMDDTLTQYSNMELSQLVDRFIHRNESEMEQIEIIRGIGHRKPAQHGARERALTLTKEREEMLLKSTGLEVPDLLNAASLKEFKAWDGDAKALPRLKLIKFKSPKADKQVT